MTSLGVDVPNQCVIQIKQSGSYVDVTVLSDDADGRRVTYRQCRTDRQITGLLLCLTPDGQDEPRRVCVDSLTIIRSAGRSRQKLVLERCTGLE